MKVKDTFARAVGGVAGAAVAVALPHVGCLGIVMFGLMGTGVANADTAPVMTYLAGGGLLLSAVAIGTTGLEPSQEACCLVWGETPRVRLKKALKVAVLGFAIAAAGNTVLGRGLNRPGITADTIAFAQMEGKSPWQILSDICTGRTPGLAP